MNTKTTVAPGAIVIGAVFLILLLDIWNPGVFVWTLVRPFEVQLSTNCSVGIVAVTLPVLVILIV